MARDTDPEDRGSSERPDYGRGEWGSEQQGGWRGPCEGPGYRQARGQTQTFQQGSAAGQIPGEYRQWQRGLPGSRDLAGFRGPDADRDAAGHRPFLEERQRGPHAGRGPKNYRRSDDRIREELCDRLMAHPEIDASDVEVEVKEAHVVLRGSVPDRRTKHRVEDVADRVLGALDIDNQLRVRRAEPTAGERH